MQSLIDFFGIKDLIPHGYGLSWSPALLWLHVISDLLITLSYCSILLIFVYFIRQRKDLSYPWPVAIFAGFIGIGGATHLLAAITIWIPLYWLDGSLKAFTAMISVVTAVLMLRVARRALSVPSVAQLQAEIRKRKTAEAALRESEFRWKFAVEGSGYGLWDWNVANGTVFFSKHWKEMLGFTEDEIGDSLDEWERRIHPDDKAETLAVVQAYLEGKTPIYISEHRVSCKDGSWKWILDRGIVVSRDAEGKPLRMIGTHADISEHKQMEEKLRDSDAFNASILNSLTSHIAVLDAQGVIVAVNSAWRQFAKENGLQEFSQSMLGVNYLDACKNAVNQLYGDEASAAQAGILAVLAGERETFHLEYPCHSPDQQRWFRMNVSPLQGSRRWVVVSHENITERKEMEAQLQKLARTDPLTGLFNRREFLERLELEVEKATRLSHYSAVLLMLDLDFFKRINDTYGHATGDAVLKAVAEILYNTSRAIDVPARLGGEEFAVLLSGADKNEALAIAERLREQVAKIVINHETGPVKITVSIGAASLSADDINGEAVLHRADTALYEAKDKGRNQTCWFGF